MPSVAVILDTTPEYFRLWLKDTTYPGTWDFSDDCMMSQNPTVGGFYDRDWCWEVLAIHFYELPDEFREDTIITFEVIPIAPTRIKVRAYSDELGRPALDALIVKMQ